MECLHGLAEMGRAGGDVYDGAVVDIFSTIELDRGVVDGIELEADEGHGHLAGEAARKVVDEQVDIHGVEDEGGNKASRK